MLQLYLSDQQIIAYQGVAYIRGLTVYACKISSTSHRANESNNFEISFDAFS